jgi:predicted DNA-binding transcriptional regulator AlpA
MRNPLKTVTVARRLLPKEALYAKFGRVIPDSTLWTWTTTLNFPAALELGTPGNRVGTIAWWEHEVDEWLDERPRRVLGGGKFSYVGPRDPATGKPTPPKRRRGRPRKAADALAEPGGTSTQINA